MVSEHEAQRKLEQASEFLSESGLSRDFNITWSSDTVPTDPTSDDVYQTGRIRFSQEIQNGLQEIIAELVDSEIRKAFEDGTKEFAAYHISNADKETVPLQYLEIDELPDFDRFRDLVENNSFRETSYSEVPNPEFQTIRIKHNGNPRVVAFQKFSRRQILGKSNRIKISLVDQDDEYDIFRPNLMAIPERIDALYFDDLLFVVNSTKFEDIFDYVEEYKSQANDVFNGLQDSNINIHNYDEFYDSVTNDRRALRKMHKVRNRGLYDELSPDDIEDIVSEFNLDLLTYSNSAGEWGIEIPDMRKKWDVIRILNDDHVLSYLTDDKFQVTGGKEER